jgi:hypothetical protein
MFCGNKKMNELAKRIKPKERLSDQFKHMEASGEKLTELDVVTKELYCGVGDVS